LQLQHIFIPNSSREQGKQQQQQQHKHKPKNRLKRTRVRKKGAPKEQAGQTHIKRKKYNEKKRKGKKNEIKDPQIFGLCFETQTEK